MKDIENKIGEVVIPDECGDTLWDAVLKQEKVKEDLKNTVGKNELLDKINELEKDKD